MNCLHFQVILSLAKKDSEDRRSLSPAACGLSQAHEEMHAHPLLSHLRSQQAGPTRRQPPQHLPIAGTALAGKPLPRVEGVTEHSLLQKNVLLFLAMLKQEPEEKSMNSFESALNPPVKYSSNPPRALQGTGEGTRKKPVTYLSSQSNMINARHLNLKFSPTDSHMLLGPASQQFPSAPLTFGAGSSCRGTVPCTAGHLIADLASATRSQLHSLSWS